jgi:hypothetical protein
MEAHPLKTWEDLEERRFLRGQRPAKFRRHRASRRAEPEALTLRNQRHAETSREGE